MKEHLTPTETIKFIIWHRLKKKLTKKQLWSNWTIRKIKDCIKRNQILKVVKKIKMICESFILELY